MTPEGGKRTSPREETGKDRTVRRRDAASRRHERRVRARKYLHDRGSAVRREVATVLHPLGTQRSQHSILPPAESPTADAAALVHELQEELRTERKEVLEPLLERLIEMGQRLRKGEDVPPADIELGLDLWQMYSERLHDVHVGQFAVARSSMPHTDSCTLPLAEIEHEPERAEHRIGEVRTMLSGYIGRPKLYRSWLGLALYGDATAELSWEGFEEDFAKACLPDHLTPTALRQWNTSIVETRKAITALRDRVGEYVRKTAKYALAVGSPGQLHPRVPSPPTVG